MMYDWMLHQGFAPIIIATKADKLKRSQLAAHVSAIRTGLSMDADAVIIPFSAETKQGREEIWALIDSLVPQEDADREAQAEDERAGKTGANHSAVEAGARESSGAHQTGNGESGSAAGADHAGNGANGGAAGEKVRKPRWKNTDRPVAKKTLKKAKAKKRK
jgi:hypothetical protein